MIILCVLCSEELTSGRLLDFSADLREVVVISHHLSRLLSSFLHTTQPTLTYPRRLAAPRAEMIAREQKTPKTNLKGLQ